MEFLSSAEAWWHKHEMDYVTVSLTNGTLTEELPGGTNTDNELNIGASYARPAGIHYNIINNNNSLFSFIAIELK